MLRRLLYILILLISFFSKSYSQGYEIKLIVTGEDNGVVTLAYYQGMKQIIVDTALLLSESKYVIRGDSLLDEGLYLINKGKGLFINILIAQDQHFEIHTDTLFRVGNTRIDSAEETEEFLEYQKFMENMNLAKTNFQKKKKAYQLNMDSVVLYEKKIEQVNLSIKNEWQSIINENQNTLLANTIKLFIQPDIPDFNIPDNDENVDSLKWFLSYQYYKQHFLDYTVFDDERLLHIPFFQEKVFTYITKIIAQHPDSMIKAVDEILLKSQNNEKVYKFFISNFLRSYELSNASGGDEVFVHLVDYYYLQGKTPWVDFNEQRNLDKKATMKKSTMYGKRIELPQLYDKKGKKIMLDDINAEKLILMFWSTDCGFCKKELTALNNFMDIASGDDMIVVALSFDIDKVKWEKYIENYSKKMIHSNIWSSKEEIDEKIEIKSLPKYIVLDRDKRIILKTYNYNTLEKELIKKN